MFFNPWSTIIFSEQFSPSWTLYLLWFLDGNTLVKSVSISEFFVFSPTYQCFPGSRAQSSFISVVFDYLEWYLPKDAIYLFIQYSQIVTSGSKPTIPPLDEHVYQSILSHYKWSESLPPDSLIPIAVNGFIFYLVSQATVWKSALHFFFLPPCPMIYKI